MEGLLFGLHIPKCAGTSLVNAISRQLEANRMYQSVSLAKNWWSNQFELEWALDKDQFDFVWGHYLQEEMIRYFRKRVILVTGLREPRDRMVSQVRYVNRIRSLQGLPAVMQESYLAENADFICNFLVSRFFLMSSGNTLLERAESILMQFNHVYFTDDYSATTAPIFNLLGIRPVVLADNTGDTNDEPVIVETEFMKNDLLLYERAESMFRGKEPQLESELPSTWLFRQTSPDLERLQRWMFQSRLDEFRSWGILDEVIAQRKLMLRSLEAEVAFYTRETAPHRI